MKFVQTLARPGGNATGLANFGSDIAGKRLQLLQELVPGLSRVGLLTSPDNEVNQLTAQIILRAGKQLGLVSKRSMRLRSNKSSPPSMKWSKQVCRELFWLRADWLFRRATFIPKLALARHLPLCAYSKETFEDGALLTYSADQIEMCRHSAVYVDKILRGAKPAELPVEQPTKLELLINLKTAKALDIKVPFHIQQVADGLVE